MTFIYDSVKIAISGIVGNKGRAFLTMLGVIIGITSVIVIMAVGEGAQSLILGELKSLGSNLVGIMPGNTGKDGPPAAVMGITVTTLTYEDALAIGDKRNLPHVVGVAPFTNGYGQVIYNNQTTDATYAGTGADYPVVQDHQILSGRFFNGAEEKSGSKVAVLGYKVWQDLFGKENPIGERVKIGKESFRVIGVMASKGTGGVLNFDEQIFTPITAMQKIVLGVNHLGLVRAKIDSADNVDSAIRDIENLLRRRHKIRTIQDDDFTVRSQNSALNIIENVTSGLQFFLTSVAAISLIVGGIGIMNIMLIAVSERTREIGLRKAIGARPHVIMGQFLTEAIIITVSGAVIGIMIGAILAYIISFVMVKLGYNWVFNVSFFSVTISLVVAFLVGLIFGLYPAKKASRLSPIEALRYE